MSKKTPYNSAVRTAFVSLLSEIRGRDKSLKQKDIAEVLKVKRQTLWLYAKGRATPGGEVIKRACDHWNVKLTLNGFEFTGAAFETRKKPARDLLPVQQTLFELLGTLTSKNLETKIVGRVEDGFLLQVLIKQAG